MNKTQLQIEEIDTKEEITQDYREEVVKDASDTNPRRSNRLAVFPMTKGK